MQPRNSYIAEAQLQYLTERARIFPCHTNRASESGHPCARYLTYTRTHWEHRSAPGPDRQALYELGNDIENIVCDQWMIRLKPYGVHMIRPKDRDWVDRKTNSTGHVDAMLEEDLEDGVKIWVPGEVKGVASGTWDEVKSHADMLTSSRSWVRKWAVQLPFYCLMDGKPYGRYIFFSKESGKLRDFVVILDDCLELLDKVSERLLEVNDHVAAGTLPDRFYEPGPPSTLCEDCDFGHLCLPGSSYDNALRIMDDPSALVLLKRHEDLKAQLKAAKGGMEKELDAIKKQLKTYFEGKPRVLLGEYLIEGKTIDVKPGNGYSYWKWDVKARAE